MSKLPQLCKHQQKANKKGHLKVNKKGYLKVNIFVLIIIPYRSS